MKSFKIVTVLALALIGVSGCSSLVAKIPPEELPKINDHYWVRSGNQFYFSVHKVRTLEGGTTEIGAREGQMEAQVVLKDGRRIVFNHPIRSEFSQDVLSVEGGNREPMTFRTNEIEAVELHISSGEGGSDEEKIVAYRLSISPRNAGVFLWGINGESMATTSEGAVYQFADTRMRNYYFLAKIVKEGYEPKFFPLRFDRVYQSEEEARRNLKTFHVVLDRKP